MRDELRAVWLIICISAHVLRAKFPMQPMSRIYHKSRSLAQWRELRAIFRRHGIKMPMPPTTNKKC
jgi:hypothetical protein